MRFGVEIELDALDGRDFSARPLSPGEMPEGTDLVAETAASVGAEVQVHGWRHNHNNSVWVCKPDSSCGIELCSPVLDESRMGEVLAVMDALASRPEITSGPNCALHVHVDASQFISGLPESSESLCAILAWWVKCEAVMLDSVPPTRRNSRFCRCIGLTDLFSHDEKVVPCMAVSKLQDKYLTLNTHHLVGRKRNSIEFRILEGTKDSRLCRSWLEFVLGFVRGSVAAGIPNEYTWVSLEDVERLVASPSSTEWLRSRILENSPSPNSRFWRARSEFEMSRLAAAGIFGRTERRVIEPQRDK